jgi:hypothetical protein
MLLITTLNLPTPARLLPQGCDRGVKKAPIYMRRNTLKLLLKSQHCGHWRSRALSSLLE